MDGVDSLTCLGPALPPRWLTYRDAFVVLQHLSTLSDGRVGIGAPWARIEAELGFTPRQSQEVLGYLERLGCVRYEQGSREVSLTQKGLRYLERDRGRRRSLRPPLAKS